MTERQKMKTSIHQPHPIGVNFANRACITRDGVIDQIYLFPFLHGVGEVTDEIAKFKQSFDIPGVYVCFGANFVKLVKGFRRENRPDFP